MRNIDVYYINEDEEKEWLASFSKFSNAEIFVECLEDKGYDENKIIYEF